MANPISMDLTGEREIVRALRNLSRGQQNKAFRKSFRTAAKHIRDRAAAKAPRDTGRLARSLKVRAGRRSREGPSITIISEGANTTSKGAPKRSRAKRLGQFRGETYYGGFVEYGTSRQAAQPFLRPAFDETLAATESTVRRELAAEIDRIWRAT